MTQKSLEKMTAKWQKRLRLQNWVISVGFVKMSDPDWYGGCNTQANFLEAEVGINDRLDDPKQIEETLVHELLHIRFCHCQKQYCEDFDTDALIGHEFEVGIDMVSRALVEAYGGD